MSADQNKRVLSEAVSCWNKGDLSGYLAMYDPSIVHHAVGPAPFDQQSNREFYESVWAAFPGIRLIIDDTVAEGDKLAARFHVTGEHMGEFMGVPATGRAIDWHGQTLMVFQDGRVVERWSTSDALGLLTQLGAIPSMESD